MLKFILFVTSAFAFDCELYIGNVPDGPNMISKEERSTFINKLCSATSVCHSTPVLNSFDAYVEDVESCYRSQMFNFNHDILTMYKKNITDLLEARSNKEKTAQLYDILNIQSRDKLKDIVETVRLRDSYIREFRYSSSKTIFGDIELQLVHRCARFSANVRNQLDTSNSLFSQTSLQLKDVQVLYQKLKSAIEKYKTAEYNLARAIVVFDNLVLLLQKNVVDSLLLIHE